MIQRRSLHVTALPQNPLCGAESVEKAAAFATTCSNELAVVVQHILQEMILKTGAFMAKALISRQGPDQPSCTSWWAEGLQCSEKGSKVKEDDKNGSQDNELAAEGVQYEAEDR